MSKFTVFFLDVWGNESDGYEVNDRSSCGTIELPFNFSDQDMIQALLDADILCSFGGKIADVFTIDSDDQGLSIYRKSDGMPLFQLMEIL